MADAKEIHNLINTKAITQRIRLAVNVKLRDMIANGTNDQKKWAAAQARAGESFVEIIERLVVAEMASLTKQQVMDSLQTEFDTRVSNMAFYFSQAESLP